ncbi:hybrid sensor histidine kinase/response regulator [Desulforapulum autotrophicum]|nr:ATP-binding protein [Desulforapulum autotrophicum]
MGSSDRTSEKNTMLTYYKGLAACSKELISGRPNAFVRVLHELLVVTQADSVSFYENFVDADDRLCARNVHLLMNQGIDSPERASAKVWFAYEDLASEWEAALGQGEIVIVDQGCGGEFENEKFKANKTAFSLLVPLFTGNHWHGFIGFEALSPTRSWQPMDIEFLTTAAEMVGGYIEKEFYISALIKSEERYRSIIENIDEGYYEIDLLGVFTFVNRRLCRMTRRTRDRFLGMNFKEVVNPETAKLIKEVAKNVYETGMPSGLNQTRVIRADGSVVVYEHSIALIEDAQGKKKGFRGIVRDATQSLDQEKKRKALEEKYFQVEKLESIATLAGGLAHEFNNLLMGIQGNTSLLLVKYHSHPMISDKIKNIERCIKRGAEVTNKLLGFARSGKYQETELDLNLLLKGVCDLFGRTRKDIRIFQNCNGDVRLVRGDSAQIEHVFLNLLLNSAQAMPGGGEIRIIVENHPVDEAFAFLHDAEPGEYVRITVSDTGTGMDAATRKRVFEPFFTTKERVRGTGLGLASVYGIVKNHSGMITLDSKRGEGTSFKVYLPACVYEQPARSAEEDFSDKQLLTILLVDDEKTVLDINIEILEVLGYRVIAAENSRDAVELFVENLDTVVLVIMDVIMPGRNGFETARLLREIKEDVKILFVSGFPKGHDQFEDVFKANEQFIQKPYTLEELNMVLNRVLENRR